jgi:hypothetical protein
MGQKSNPNSFHFKKKTSIIFGGSHRSIEYSTILREYLSASSNLISFFEKNHCLIKECFFTLSSDKSFITIFISFLILKRLKKKQGRKQKIKVKNSPLFETTLIVRNLFNVLKKFGHIGSKRIILQNLRRVALKAQKKRFSVQHSEAKSFLKSFSKEIYFESGLLLFCLLNITRNNASLISKFIARFFRIFHRTKKINKFLFFLSKFLQCVEFICLKENLIQGLKFQIKGRFSGSSRSRIRIFEKGCIPLQTVVNKIDYSLIHVNTSYGVFGVKVWVFE